MRKKKKHEHRSCHPWQDRLLNSPFLDHRLTNSPREPINCRARPPRARRNWRAPAHARLCSRDGAHVAGLITLAEITILPIITCSRVVHDARKLEYVILFNMHRQCHTLSK